MGTKSLKLLLLFSFNSSLLIWGVEPIRFSLIDEIDKEDTLHDFTFEPSSISVKGDYLYVGESGDDENGINTGAIHIFKRSNNEWGNVDKLTSNISEDKLGYSLSGSEGQLIGIGQRNIILSNEIGGGWNISSTLSTDLYFSSFGRQALLYQNEIILSDEGYGNGFDNTGRVFVFEQVSGNLQVKQEISAPFLENINYEYVKIGDGSSIGIASHESLRGEFGQSISINENKMLISAPSSYHKYGDEVIQTGSVYLYENNEDEWIHKYTFTPPIEIIEARRDNISYLSGFGHKVILKEKDIYILHRYSASSWLFYRYSLIDNEWKYRGTSISKAVDFDIEEDTMCFFNNFGDDIFIYGKLSNDEWGYQSKIDLNDDNGEIKEVYLHNGFLYCLRSNKVAIYKKTGEPQEQSLPDYEIPIDEPVEDVGMKSGGGCFLK